MAEGPRDNAGPRGRPCGAPRGRWVRIWRAHGLVGPGKNLGAVTQMRYRAPIFNHDKFQNFLRVGLCPTRSIPLQVTWTHGDYWMRSERWRSRGPESTRSLKRDTCQEVRQPNDWARVLL